MTTTYSPAVGSLSTPVARVGPKACDALIAQIHDGDSAAVERFRMDYSPGVRALFDHHLGKIGLDDLVTQTMTGALEEIKRGRIGTSQDWTRFVRAVLARKKQSADPAIPRVAVNLGTTVTTALAAVRSDERRMLSRFYVDGCSIPEIEREFAIPAVEISALLDRFRQSVRAPRTMAARA